MPVMRKDVLQVGKIKVSRPNGEIETIEFKLGDLENAAKVGNQKLSEGWAIPAVWEHQNVGPVKDIAQLLADQSKNTFGHLKGFEVDAKANRLFALVDVASEADAEQLAKVRFCSPEVQWNFTDSDGKTWDGPTISHLAATPRPRQKNQAEWVQLSADGVGDTVKRIRFSLGDYAMDFEKIKTFLAGLGVTLPEDVTAETLMAALSAAADAAANKPAEGENKPAPPSTTSPIGLSLEQTANLLQGQITANQRVLLGQRVAGLVATGRVSPAIAKTLTDSVAKVQLSITAEGQLLPSETEIMIKAYEQLPEKAGFAPQGQKLQMSHATVADDQRGIDKGDPASASESFLGEWDKVKGAK